MAVVGFKDGAKKTIHFNANANALQDVIDFEAHCFVYAATVPRLEVLQEIFNVFLVMRFEYRTKKIVERSAR